MSKLLKFPDKFLWGVAYSSHQVEGNNKNNDWWEWEQQGKTKDKSGWACDSWNRYPLDHELAQNLGCNAFRLSLEWSRIEPSEGHFSSEAIEHYRKVLQDLKRRNMKRVVTLWHWTNPKWFSENYGWHKKESVEFFARYCEKVTKELGEEIDLIVTMNEPQMYLTSGYIRKYRPPGYRSFIKYKRARKNMVAAHKACYETIKKYQDVPVGITQLSLIYESIKGKGFLNRIAKRLEKWYIWNFFSDINDFQDFIGIDYYFRISFQLKKPFALTFREGEEISDLDWGIYPRGLYEIVMKAWKDYQKPVYISENGLADKKDAFRKEFIENHLRSLKKAIDGGAQINGYFHWSLIDNFEWHHGYDYKFGLCEMDYRTMERKPRPSYYYYQKIIRENGLES